jgi:NADH dehydrogenase FAD-containing subunit
MIVLRGGGAGLNAPMTLAGHEGRVTIVDQPSTSHHRFQPATDQVTTDGLSPADIALRIRGFNKGR